MPKKNKKQKKKQNKKTSNIIESKQIMFMKRKFFLENLKYVCALSFLKSILMLADSLHANISKARNKTARSNCKHIFIKRHKTHAKHLFIRRCVSL